MADPQNQGFRFCHLQHVIFTSWYLMAAGALAILSASQTAGKAKGFICLTTGSVLHFTYISLIRTYTPQYGREGKDPKSFNWTHNAQGLLLQEMGTLDIWNRLEPLPLKFLL